MVHSTMKSANAQAFIAYCSEHLMLNLVNSPILHMPRTFHVGKNRLTQYIGQYNSWMSMEVQT